MLNITKNEAFDMRKMGYGDYIKMSNSRHPKYYLVEDYKVLKVYEKYRNSKIAK